MRALVAVCLTFLTTGCIGGTMAISGTQLNYPVSASPFVQDEAGNLLGPDQLEEVHRFELRQKNWTIAWSLADLTPDEWDLSNELNELIQQHHGEAVTGLEVTARNCSINYVILLNLFPFWPGCADVRVTGAVVRRREGIPHPAPTPPAVPPPAVSGNVSPPPATPPAAPPVADSPPPPVALPETASPPPPADQAEDQEAESSSPSLHVRPSNEVPTGFGLGGGLGLSLCLPNGDTSCHDIHPSFGMEVEGLYRFFPYVAAELDFSFGLLDLDWGIDGEDNRNMISLALLAGVRGYLPIGPVDIFAGLGFGWGMYQINDVDDVHSSVMYHGFALALSIGAEYLVTRSLGLGLVLRFHFPFYSQGCNLPENGDRDCTDLDGDIWFRLLIGARLTYYF